MSYSESCLFNRYLDRGDEQVLDFLMRQFAGTIAWTKEHRTFFVNLRRWNLTLPEKERIRFAGVDVEHQRGVALRYLAELARPDSGKTPPADIAATIAALQRVDREGSGKMGGRVCRRFSVQRGCAPGGIRGVVRRQAVRFRTGSREPTEGCGVLCEHGTERSAALRERVMYDTFLKLCPRLGGAKCYGRWGAAHVMQQPVDRGETFAGMLNRPESPVKGKVVTIFPLYEVSEALTMPGYRKQLANSDPGFLQPFSMGRPLP
jgi:hypothetical protein